MSGGLTRFLGTQDMTVGSPIKKLIQFSIPLLLGNLAQQMYNTVDSIVVGRYVGDNALAAVGASGPMLNLLLVLFIGISTGANVMVAQYFGAKQREQLSKAVGTTITLTFLASLVIMVVGPLLVPPFLELVGTPPEIFEWTADYLTIVFWGIAGMAYYNIIAGVLRGMGDSVMPLVFLLVACGLNIVLDLLFVTQFHWDVAGVAWATIIAQFISAILCLWRLMRMTDTLDINWHTLRPKSHMVKELLVLGLPSGVSQAIFSTAAIVVQSLTNSFGTVIIAVNTVVMRVDGFAMMPNFTFGNAMTTYTGQNMGAGRVDRVEEGVREGMRLGLAVIAALVAAILLFGGQLVGLFTEHAGGDRAGPAHDADLGRGLFGHGCHPDPLRRDARRRRHHDPHVDLHDHHCGHPCSHRLWAGGPDKEPGQPVYQFADLLVYGRAAVLCRL